ncbi:MAG: SpoIID/LytB domain-containing protein [Candidatus Omnitrophica bacterium]|nr:SpoIID/LytB domain-containing protein [Candidatus Omnitrophota bacterium]
MVKKIISFLLLTAIFLFLGDAAVTAKSKLIRVAVLRNVDHCVIGIDGPYTMIDMVTGVKIDAGARMRPALVCLKAGKINIGNKSYEPAKIIIQPQNEATLRIDDRHFRGSITIIRDSDPSFTVINSIEIEQYIRGVLYHEVSDKWPLEAIEAQAVATRTYALYAIEKSVTHDYDVTNDIYSQVYGGKTSERYITNIAVKQTRGEVLTYKGKIFPAFFHANSGGITEDAYELWQIDLPPLRGGVESPFSVNSPHYNWSKNFRLKDIQDKLNTKGLKLGLIKDIQVIERNKSGRVRKLQITTRDGKTEIMDGKVFREDIGPNVLRSNKYDVVMKGWYVDFVGHGWGHGVGLDQWGAYNMARLRYSYKQILSFYYPGSELVRFQDID